MLKLPRILSLISSHEPEAWNRPAIPLLLSLIFGILLGDTWPGKTLFFSIIAILFTLTIFLQAIQKRSSFFQPFLLFVCLGYLSIQPWSNLNLPPNHVILHADGNKHFITGIIQTSPIQKHHRLRFVLDTKTIHNGENKTKVTGKLRVTISGETPLLRKGDRIAIKSRIRPIRNFNNPGGFDYKKYMAFKGVRGSAYARGDQLQILEHNQVNSALIFIETVREKISTHLDRSISGKPQQILKALLLGNRSGISNDLRESFTRSGVSHVLAISGLHIGIIASTAFLVFSWMLSWIPILLWKARVKKIAAFGSILPILFYGILAGMSPSTQRAVIMVIIFLLTFPMEKEHDLINTISIAALFILIFSPPALFSVSFQLSFSAVLSIVYGLSKIKPSTHDPKNHRQLFLYKIFLFIMVSFFAILGTLPLVMYYFNQVSLIGMITNLIAIPAIGFLVLPLGFLSILILPASSYLATVCVQFCGFILSNTIRIINFLADLPFAALKTITPNLFEIICIYIFFWCILNLIKPPRDSGKNSIITQKKIIQLITGITTLLIVVDLFFWVHTRFFHDDLRIHMLDVGQGSAAVLELPDGHNMLIDGGGFSNNKVFNIGAKVVAPFLWRKKIGSIDTLVLSHPNSDHMNGLIFIAKHFNVKNFWSNNEKANTQSFLELQNVILKNKIHHPSYKELPINRKINGVEIRILYPDKNFLLSGENHGNTNNNSLVIKIIYKNHSFLFPGDIETKGEKKLVATRGNSLKSTVLLAPHHGSRTSSSKKFLKAVMPEYVVISVGWKNRFQMPHKIVMNRYNALGCGIYRTDYNGCVSITTDGNSLTFVTQ